MAPELLLKVFASRRQIISLTNDFFYDWLDSPQVPMHALKAHLSHKFHTNDLCIGDLVLTTHDVLHDRFIDKLVGLCQLNNVDNTWSAKEAVLLVPFFD